MTIREFFIPEKEIKDYLDKKLEDVQVTMEVLEGTNIAPSQFVTVEKTGSSARNQIHSATIAIQSYGKTMYEAAVLNERVKEFMDDLPYSNTDFQDSDLNSDYNYTDTANKRYRYQAIYEVKY